LKFFDTVARHVDDVSKAGDFSRPYNNSILTIQEIMKDGKPKLDPQNVKRALK